MEAEDLHPQQINELCKAKILQGNLVAVRYRRTIGHPEISGDCNCVHVLGRQPIMLHLALMLELFSCNHRVQNLGTATGGLTGYLVRKQWVSNNIFF